MRRSLRVALLLLAGALLVALRILAAPRLLEMGVPASIVALRARIATAGLVAGAGFGLAAVAAQARSREASLDASLTGPVWGALPGLLVPGPLIVQGVVAVLGAAGVAWLTARGQGGFSNVLARGVAVAGLVVSLAALGLFLGPGLTPSTATAFLHAALGGQLLRATWSAVTVGGVLVVAALVAALVGWRSLLLARSGVAPGGRVPGAVVVLASAGSVVVAGVIAGLGLIATRIARGVVGEHPRALVPGALGVGAGLAAGLDGVAQAVAWPGELPVGVVTLVVASGLLSWKVVPRDRG